MENTEKIEKNKCYQLKIKIFDCLYKEDVSYESINTNDYVCVKLMKEFKKKCI